MQDQITNIIAKQNLKLVETTEILHRLKWFIVIDFITVNILRQLFKLIHDPYGFVWCSEHVSTQSRGGKKAIGEA